MSSVVFRSSQDTHSLLSDPSFKLLPTDFVRQPPPFLQRCSILYRVNPVEWPASPPSKPSRALWLSHCVLHRNTRMFLPMNSVQYRVTWALCSTVGARVILGPCQPVLIAQSQSPSLGPAEEQECSAPISSLIITFCSTPALPHLLMPPKYSFSAKRSKLEKAAKHRNGTRGGGMKGHWVTHPVSRVLLMLHCHMKKLFSKSSLLLSMSLRRRKSTVTRRNAGIFW